MSVRMMGLLVGTALMFGCAAPASGPAGSASSNETAGSPATTEVKAPTIDKVEKMTGALHVSWSASGSSCDTFEGERQAQMSDGSVMEKYKVVFSVPGSADSEMDGSATDDMKYTYRLRCKKGSAYSAYSNELSGNPVE